MTDPRIVSNLRKLVSAKAPDDDIREYLESEGISEKEALSALRASNIAEKTGVTASDNPIVGGARALGQGLTFGFGDEIEAGVKSALGSGSYRDNVDAIRARQEQFAGANPTINLALELAGGMVVPGGAMKGVATVGQAARRGAMLGAGMGAASGAGVAETMGDIPGNMVQGGLAGAALGGAMPFAGAAARAGAGRMADFGLRSQARMAQRADDVVNRGLERDGITHDQLLEGVNAGEREGVRLGVMDVAGANTLGVARAATMVPSSAKEIGLRALEERAMGQAQRVADSVVEKSGVPKSGYRETAERLMEQRAKDADPLYKAAYAAGKQIDDDEILGLLHPDGQLAPELPEVWAAARRIAKRDGVDLKPVYKTTETDGMKVVEWTGEKPDLQTLDYIKRGLDSIINRTGSTGLAGVERSQVIRSKKALVERLKTIVPEYGKALDSWRGPTEALEALEAGRGFLNESADMTAAEIAKLPKAEKEMFRIGAVAAIRDRVFTAKDGASQWGRIFGSPEHRARIRAIFPDDASFDSFRKAMELEARGSASARSILHGSRTTPAAQEVADLGIDPGALMEFAATGFSPTQIPRIAGMAGMRSYLQLGRGAVAESLGKNLFNFDPAFQRKYIEQLRQRDMARRAEIVRRNQHNALLGGVAGRQAGLFAE